ncbi:MAG: thiamine-phosphate kinase [Solirubrobacteraceae bacterium]
MSSRPTISTARGSSTDIAERALIDAIVADLGARGGRVICGPGDDAAVVRSKPLSVTSVDTSVEGVHFRLSDGWPSAHDVGWRSLAAALSDLAAMGAEAGEAYVGLGIPRGLGEQTALELMRGAHELADRTATTIAGGDVVRAPALFLAITAVGWAQEPGGLLTRSGARAGDMVAVTGSLGAASAALAMLEGPSAGPASVQPGEPEALVMERFRRPMPRLAEGIAIARAGASAMIDLSDGLASDAGHIGRASGVRLRIQLDALPLAPGLEAVAGSYGRDPFELAASGGEDYELCLTAPPEHRATLERAVAACPAQTLTWVGEVVSGEPGVSLVAGDGSDRPLHGFEHRW